MSKFIKYQGLAVSALLLACSTGVALAAPQTGTPADGALINEQQVLYWLIKRGELAADASEAEQQAAIDAFVSRGRDAKFKPAAIEVKAEQVRLKQAVQKSAKSAQYVAANSTVQADQDITKTVKVLAVLVDFPDLPHDANQLAAGDTDMYYSSYPASHYQQLLFSETGFAGPNNQTLQSAYQYFQAVSGNSFYFTGQVQDWVTADNNAAFYGSNNSDEDDTAVPDLVKEAVVKAVEGMSDTELKSYDIEDPYDLDSDGNYDEADGIIDHVMLFHSSIGEEAGGGVLGDDAIWSHRYYVDSTTNGYTIPGRGLKVFGYTVQPIDAAAGVCTHEFGHDLGLPDEYDLTNSGDGSPVGEWSLMSGGSWTGSIAGSQPSGFSPYAKSYLQQKYKGKWVNEQHISLADLTSSGSTFQLNQAINTDEVNQLSIALPAENIAFKSPFTGEYQYYSGQGNMLNNAMSFDVTLPLSTSLALTFKAHWDIEEDYDYVQVLVDSVAIAGNYTSNSNSVNSSIKNFITGKSSDIAGSTGENSWVDLNFDLSAYAGRTVQISVVYKTDEAVDEYGMAIDDIQLTNQGNAFYIDGAEADDVAALAGFSRIDDTLPGKAKRYIVQLRSHQGVDAGLVYSRYVPGVLLWLENLNYSDNNVSEHPGEGLIGVIDADQNLIGTRDTEVQIRDATFSLYSQSTYTGDTHLDAESLFDDSRDYSAPLKPQAGMILPELGLTMQVTEQASDSSTARLEFALADSSVLPDVTLTADIIAQVNGANVSFSAQVTGGSDYTYAWSFGDNATSTDVAPTYTYAQSGDYDVSVIVKDSAGNTVTATKTVRVVIAPLAAFTLTQTDASVSMTNASTQGFGGLTYLWDFGDGSATSTVLNPSHTYTQSGSYTVTLVATDSLGNESTVSQNVTVTIAVTTPTTPTTTSTDTGSSSGGGSLGWLSMMLLAFVGVYRQRVRAL